MTRLDEQPAAREGRVAGPCSATPKNRSTRPATVQVMPEQSELPVSILIEGKQVESETRVTSIGPCVLVLDTVIPEEGVQLYSTYTGHEGTGTLATHLKLAKGGIRETVAAEHEHDSIPVMYARRRALYDHLQNLQDLLDEAGIEASIPIDEGTIVAVED